MANYHIAQATGAAEHKATLNTSSIFGCQKVWEKQENNFLDSVH
jgi:hypothetical protein